ncbi:hypothetical protein HS088_TW23G01036 [Tripterygium wilfordii]|uniref:PPM-type phosphatase domain-containing protein n=1 Tax=Tripterygium wilfordii TaxID=458696 RepID=A0A7J7BWP0_TRIWF|nr:hypothetical protein HS088_TW23G01036 [Tripterygium wilfordii]
MLLLIQKFRSDFNCRELVLRSTFDLVYRLITHWESRQEEKVDSSLEFLILASDGLWDVVTNEDAVAMIKPIQDPEEAAKRLLQEAYQRGSADNITCVVVRFLANQGGSSLSGSG